MSELLIDVASLETLIKNRLNAAVRCVPKPQGLVIELQKATGMRVPGLRTLKASIALASPRLRGSDLTLRYRVLKVAGLNLGNRTVLALASLLGLTTKAQHLVSLDRSRIRVHLDALRKENPWAQALKIRSVALPEPERRVLKISFNVEP
ncbi:MAG TPA: hypothetical protein VEK08_24050 [Planctomycetota bacterium]|nr:hypothetical protein [Planctomycetota bacterium]